MSFSLEERLQAASPEPPPILSIPVLALFTNQPAFGGHCRIEYLAPQSRKPLAGELLHRANEFLFAAQAQEKKARGRETTFIWNTATNGGITLNDALPGYAPIGARAQVTSLQTTGKAPFSDKINGHACTQERVTIAVNDGSETQLTVWRAADLNGLPVRIRSESGTGRFVIDLNDVRLEQPSAALFEVPRDFTKYDSPKAMYDELLRRESLAGRSNKGQPAFDEETFQRTGAMRPNY